MMSSHRELRFRRIEEVEEELARIERWHADGNLETTGNWTAGQILNHLGAWIEYGFEGYPAELRPPPLPVRMMLRLVKGRFLERPLPPGFRFPHLEAGTLATEVVGFEEGSDRLRGNLARLKSAAPSHPSPAFGMLTHEQAIKLTLRHAELHLGFLRPKPE